MLKAAAHRADGLAVRVGPTYLAERLAGLVFRHAENLGQLERAGVRGLEESG